MSLKAYLASKKITFEAFGRRVGVSKAAVGRYCRGDRIPTAVVMRRILQETGGIVTPGDFYQPMGETESVHTPSVCDGPAADASGSEGSP